MLQKQEGEALSVRAKFSEEARHLGCGTHVGPARLGRGTAQQQGGSIGSGWQEESCDEKDKSGDEVEGLRRGEDV